MKRCPFCVAPFPILKCVNFDTWECPRCETNFSLDVSNHLNFIILLIFLIF